MLRSKQDFVELADAIREHNHKVRSRGNWGGAEFLGCHLATLAGFLQASNPKFDKQRWLDYIAGRCGPGGGKRDESSR